jgi:hypothetical protein
VRESKFWNNKVRCETEVLDQIVAPEDRNAYALISTDISIAMGDLWAGVPGLVRSSADVWMGRSTAPRNTATVSPADMKRPIRPIV